MYARLSTYRFNIDEGSGDAAIEDRIRPLLELFPPLEGCSEAYLLLDDNDAAVCTGLTFWKTPDQAEQALDQVRERFMQLLSDNGLTITGQPDVRVLRLAIRLDAAV